MKILKDSLNIDIKIQKVFKKSLSRHQNIRVGRVTGNKTFSYFFPIQFNNKPQKHGPHYCVKSDLINFQGRQK